MSTLIVHGVYSWRIFRFSKKNYWITVPIMVLAFIRFISACITTAHMITLRSFEKFRHSGVQWVFSVGLILTCVVDMMITATMMIILRQSRAQSLSLDGVIDSLILYSLETGAATVIMTIAMLITWLAMHENLIFMALHFIIAKLYANSVVAMLNYRQTLRDRAALATSRSGDAVDLDAIRLGHERSRSGRYNIFSGTRSIGAMIETTSNVPMEVNVTKTMQMHTDESLMESEDRTSAHGGVSKPPRLNMLEDERLP
ncbi:hypothetical protein GYMLUDRAFT_97305 [Collybiopsis luxurians FD-317 M1]|uniref:DUF6534 domain-containing protein n=1 Tax=Collybiopsis luxurians FD-317 M1 TaxID=944289 RepID=A0A0D0CVG3_9AGAR|nr:hypothetical protein GYMLUDRAFT_97305 [Collybiopsis luxurians FD-317 M1]